MKRVIVKASRVSDGLTNHAKDWFVGDEVDELMKGCTPQEKRLIGKIANSPDPVLYVMDVADVIDTLQVKISSSFDKFLEKALEIMK